MDRHQAAQHTLGGARMYEYRARRACSPSGDFCEGITRTLVQLSPTAGCVIAHFSVPLIRGLCTIHTFPKVVFFFFFLCFLRILRQSQQQSFREDKLERWGRSVVGFLGPVTGEYFSYPPNTLCSLICRGLQNSSRNCWAPPFAIHSFLD